MRHWHQVVELTLVVVDPLQQDLRILPLPPQQYVITALTRYGAYQTDGDEGAQVMDSSDLDDALDNDQYPEFTDDEE